MFLRNHFKDRCGVQFFESYAAELVGQNDSLWIMLPLTPKEAFIKDTPSFKLYKEEQAAIYNRKS